jgi:hypothetical protein
MKKNFSQQTAPDGEANDGTVPKRTPPQSEAADPSPSPSTPHPAEGPFGLQKARKGSRGKVENDVMKLAGGLQALVNKMLKEGMTFEDVVEAVNARGGQRITLNAVKGYFQGNRMLQSKRARRQVEDAEALLAFVDKDPKSAEARLARATFLTGYSKVNRNASVVTPREAARYRMECDNLNLKHQILMLQKTKAKQDLEYSRARTNLLQITQAKMQGEILRLERELRAHRAGEPIGPEVLQQIRQLYGLACQPLLEEVSASVCAKA